MKKNILYLITLLITSTLIVNGCASTKSTEGSAQSDTNQSINASFKDISELSIPENVSIVGLGEATHGNHEFYELKKDIFKILIESYNYRVFALEGDFGGCAVVNNYIVNDEGTAESAVNAIGFAVYKMEEMKDLIEWMHDYNMDKPNEEKIRFYGFDMQRYDNNKSGLLDFIKKVDNSKVSQYESSLSNLNDETVFDQDEAKIKEGLNEIDKIISEMEQNKDAYINASSEQEYDFALEFANSIKENATLRGTNVPYGDTRDNYMAKKVLWILEQEKKIGNGKIFLSGHNGHIEKSSKSNGLKTCMGDHLSKELGEGYYSIGTDFYENTFLCKESSSGERKEFTIKNDSKLINEFLKSNSDIALLNIKENLNNGSFSEILKSNQTMGNVGDDFSNLSEKLKSAYTLSMVPEKAYDSIIFVKSATPTKQMEINK